MKRILVAVAILACLAGAGTTNAQAPPLGSVTIDDEAVET